LPLGGTPSADRGKVAGRPVRRLDESVVALDNFPCARPTLQGKDELSVRVGVVLHHGNVSRARLNDEGTGKPRDEPGGCCYTSISSRAGAGVGQRPDGPRERYDDVVVDPETLEVQVRQGTGDWRQADRLSEGTKEQIFLLLRVALAEHLTKPGEKAPLILDEITAQCDATRRAALLDLLHELSGDRQIVLFTHDEGALAWAEEHLDLDGADALVRRDVLEPANA